MSLRTPERDLAVLHILAASLLALPMLWPVAARVGSGWFWPALLGLSLLAGTVIHGLRLLVGAFATGVVLQATGAHGAAGTATHFAMSVVDTLLVRGRADEAIAQLQAAQFVHDGVTGAEIAQRLGDVLRERQRWEESAQAYRRARRLWESVRAPEGRTGRVYATRRLLDLYDGPLANPAAAERERMRLPAA